MKASCVECGRVFDLMNETDLQEAKYGHDCEVPASTRNESYWFDHADGRFI